MVTSEEIWRRANQLLIEIQIRRRKWTWIGHTLRKPKTTIVNQALRWTRRDIGSQEDQEIHGEDQ